MSTPPIDSSAKANNLPSKSTLATTATAITYASDSHSQSTPLRHNTTDEHSHTMSTAATAGTFIITSTPDHVRPDRATGSSIVPPSPLPPLPHLSSIPTSPSVIPFSQSQSHTHSYSHLSSHPNPPSSPAPESPEVVTTTRPRRVSAPTMSSVAVITTPMIGRTHPREEQTPSGDEFEREERMAKRMRRGSSTSIHEDSSSRSSPSYDSQDGMADNELDVNVTSRSGMGLLSVASRRLENADGSVTSSASGAGMDSNLARNNGAAHGGSSSQPKKKRTRTLTTPHQSAVLHALLAKSRFPTTAVREEVGRSIGLSARKVQIWFQNQRQKARRPRSQGGDPSSRGRSHQYGPFPSLPESSSAAATVAAAVASAAGGLTMESNPIQLMHLGSHHHHHHISYGGGQQSQLHQPHDSPVEGYSDTTEPPLRLLGPGMPGVDPYSGVPSYRARPSTATGAPGSSSAGYSSLPSRGSHEQQQPYYPSSQSVPSSSSGYPRPASAHGASALLSRTLPPLNFTSSPPPPPHSAPASSSLPPLHQSAMAPGSSGAGSSSSSRQVGRFSSGLGRSTSYSDEPHHAHHYHHPPPPSTTSFTRHPAHLPPFHRPMSPEETFAYRLPAPSPPHAYSSAYLAMPSITGSNNSSGPSGGSHYTAPIPQAPPTHAILNIPPPFTLQPQPQWDTAAFNAVPRPSSSAWSRPTSASRSLREHSSSPLGPGNHPATTTLPPTSSLLFSTSPSTSPRTQLIMGSGTNSTSTDDFHVHSNRPSSSRPSRPDGNE